ncbi:MAG TPA: Hsp70 family protein, partial [Magnetospirillaceae bacterium]|nr:Hsp70 family protein [Magnetospirillaceae bacterium]
MLKRNIGIKLADGQFYHILEEGRPARKRLIVTTVKDDQPSVQIDMYRGQGQTAAGAAYIGSLVIENIPPRPSGEPDIRLELSLDESGELVASAREESSGAKQSLRVSLQALSEEEKYEVPDFEFEEEIREAASTDELPDLEAEEPEVGRPGFGAGLLAAAEAGFRPQGGAAEDASAFPAIPLGENESYIGQTFEVFSPGKENPSPDSAQKGYGPEGRVSAEKSGPGTFAGPSKVERPAETAFASKPESPRRSARTLWIVLFVLVGIAVTL